MTGQAGWYDVRVRIYPAHADERPEVFPQFSAPARASGPKTGGVKKQWLAYFAGGRNKGEVRNPGASEPAADEKTP